MDRYAPMWMFVVLTLVSCNRQNPSGLTKEQAEAVLVERGYAYPTSRSHARRLVRLCVSTRLADDVGKNGTVTFKP